MIYLFIYIYYNVWYLLFDPQLFLFAITKKNIMF